MERGGKWCLVGARKRFLIRNYKALGLHNLHLSSSIHSEKAKLLSEKVEKITGDP